MYYLYGAKKYRYFQDQKEPIIHEFIRQRLEKQTEDCLKKVADLPVFKKW